MIRNEHKTTEIHHLITGAFRASRVHVAAGSRHLLTSTGSIGVVGGRGVLVATQLLRSDVPAAPALPAYTHDRRGSTDGVGSTVGITNVSLERLFERGLIDHRALNILMSSESGRARLQRCIESVEDEDENPDNENNPLSVSRDTEIRHLGHGKHGSEGAVSRLGVIRWLLILIIVILIFKSF